MGSSEHQGSAQPNPRKSMGSGWSEWWKQKRINNEEFLAAAETGDLAKLKRCLDTAAMQGK